MATLRHGSLEGHSFGNLFVAALAEITGDFAQAIKLSSQVLATRGHIYPATTTNVTLSARMDDGSTVEGETNITASQHRICELTLEPAGAEPLPETLDSIARADLITLGPGSLYTSLITNLLVKGIPEALAAAHGLRVFICNLMTQSNESLGLTASQHIEKIYEHTGQAIFDYALVNTAPVSETLLRNYAREGATPIVPDIERIEALGVRVIPGTLRQRATRCATTRTAWLKRCCIWGSTPISINPQPLLPDHPSPLPAREGGSNPRRCYEIEGLPAAKVVIPKGLAVKSSF